MGVHCRYIETYCYFSFVRIIPSSKLVASTRHMFVKYVYICPPIPSTLSLPWSSAEQLMNIIGIANGTATPTCSGGGPLSFVVFSPLATYDLPFSR